MATKKLHQEEIELLERIYFLNNKLRNEKGSNAGLSKEEYKELEDKIEHMKQLTNGCLVIQF